MKHILVVGGSRYFGKSLVTRLRDAGDEVTVLNRGSSAPPPGVGRLLADRDDEAGLRAALGGRDFDVVIDQVCYTPLQAAVARRVFAARTGRYVMTSTMEVYDPATLPAGSAPHAVPVAEAALDPGRPPLAPPFPDRQGPGPGTGTRTGTASATGTGTSTGFSAATRYAPDSDAHAYAEGKRRAEAVFLREPPFPFVSVRTAHVLGGGPAEFTGRLAHYVQRIRTGRPVDVHQAPYGTSFIHHLEMAEFLDWTARHTFTGPVNAASHGAPDVLALCSTVAGQLGREPRYRVVGAGEAASPFSFDRAYAMDNGRAEGLGFPFGRVADWLPGAVAETA
ncbi:NAD-dependent epimerase/dehydratase family protein [Streptomyces sp. NRRL F-2664]|uniref:NAD-dependent epimerase/dehydratase family protein n=1 Tax=Streptomyces sp. NRRL F-2664 TaxID=1463842 RepID=UPI0004CC1691|nr:NAD-dependent epimerase/dehydratase family protein [Streptomyces sp. NRRL F-2664]